MKPGLLLVAALVLAGCSGGSGSVTDPGTSSQDSGVAASSSSGGSGGSAAMVTELVTFTASDGVKLTAYLSGAGNYQARPLIVEFSPYGPTSFSAQFAGPAAFGNDFGPAYNYLEVNARGTGHSQGVWGAVGPRDQQDVAEVLAWACQQPWSNGHIGLYGFSASAIAVYNSLHLPLVCVDAASLMAGSDDLYRDLLYPGGIFNLLPAGVVAFGVSEPLLQSGLLQQNQTLPSALASFLGQIGLYDSIFSNVTEDAFWQQRTERRNPAGPNTFPVLADTSFYDPEPRGPFESFKLLRSLGVTVHLMTYGAHDGYPAGTQGPFPEFQRWFDHYLLGSGNGVDSDPAVQLLVGNGSFNALKSGSYTSINADDWPIPGTQWQALYLNAARSGSARSLNDGSFSVTAPAAQSHSLYADIPTLGTASDPASASVVINALQSTSFNIFDVLPFLVQMNLAEPHTLTWTTAPFTAPVDVVGQGSLDLFAATVLTEDDLYTVIADVWPDGTSYPIAEGQLRNSYPNIVTAQSVIVGGEVVQPYADYSAKDYAVPLQTREYHIEFWPIGNHFAAGHRLRVYVLGTSDFMMPYWGVNEVSIGGATPSRLLLPVLPGSNALAAAGS
jgi:uncharacterized protein